MIKSRLLCVFSSYNFLWRGHSLSAFGFRGHFKVHGPAVSRPRWPVTDSSCSCQILCSLHAPPVCRNYSRFRLLCSPKLSFPALFVDQWRSCSPRCSNIKHNNYGDRNVKMQNDVLGAWMRGKCPFLWERNRRAWLNSWNWMVPLRSWDLSFSDRDSMVGFCFSVSYEI